MGVIRRYIDDENAAKIVVPQIPIEPSHAEANDDSRPEKGAKFNRTKILSNLSIQM